MTYVLIIVSVLAIVLASVRPKRSSLTAFEVIRRKRYSRKNDLEDRRFEEFGVVRRLGLMIISTAIAVVTISAISVFGIVGGIIYAVSFSWLMWPISQIKLIGRLSNWLYGRTENIWLNLAHKLSKTVPWLINNQPVSQYDSQSRVFSKDELLEVLGNSVDAFDNADYQLISHSLTFRDKNIQTVMEPLATITSVSQDELLGPIVLSELHRTKQEYIPVIKGDQQTVVGLIYLPDFTRIDSNTKSPQAYQVMNRDVCFIEEKLGLDQALRLLSAKQQSIAVVTNSNKQAVGMVSVKDIIVQLFGQ